ncbi:hypothetical protein ACQ4N7_12425 [Nodosilinea sp. AN01ver1]|uniref:hypothetical protein n=1 Tax=Nodosilinea sp. AN01ver1 TaxID=3423362 RepID=UPI003D3235FB
MIFQFHFFTLRAAIAAVAVSSTVITGTTLIADRAVALPGAAIAQAAVIPASSVQQETLYLNTDRTYSYNLTVEQGVTVNGLYLPPGAEIQGQYVPAEGGLRYDASSVVVDGRSYPLNASSSVIEDIKDPRDTTVGSIAEDAGIGAAGGLVLGEILGDAGLGAIVGGAAAGAATGNLTADRVVVVEPNTTIDLYL